MSNGSEVVKGWKLVPVEPTEEMNKAGIRWLNGLQHMRAVDKRNALNEAFKAMADVAPQPPALGVEVEVEYPHFSDQGMGCGLEDRGITDRYEAMRYGWDEAMDRCAGEVVEPLRAHVTRLQAELAQSNAAHEAAAQHQGDLNTQIYKLQAEVDNLSILQNRLLSECKEANIKLDSAKARTAELEALLRDARSLWHLPAELKQKIDAALNKTEGQQS